MKVSQIENRSGFAAVSSDGTSRPGQWQQRLAILYFLLDRRTQSQSQSQQGEADWQRQGPRSDHDLQ